MVHNKSWCFERSTMLLLPFFALSLALLCCCPLFIFVEGGHFFCLHLTKMVLLIILFYRHPSICRSIYRSAIKCPKMGNRWRHRDVRSRNGKTENTKAETINRITKREGYCTYVYENNTYVSKHTQKKKCIIIPDASADADTPTGFQRSTFTVRVCTAGGFATRYVIRRRNK